MQKKYVKYKNIILTTFLILVGFVSFINFYLSLARQFISKEIECLPEIFHMV